jgi:hypothetical protein
VRLGASVADCEAIMERQIDFNGDAAFGTAIRVGTGISTGTVTEEDIRNVVYLKLRTVVRLDSVLKLPDATIFATGERGGQG